MRKSGQGYPHYQLTINNNDKLFELSEKFLTEHKKKTVSGLVVQVEKLKKEQKKVAFPGTMGTNGTLD